MTPPLHGKGDPTQGEAETDQHAGQQKKQGRILRRGKAARDPGRVGESLIGQIPAIGERSDNAYELGVKLTPTPEADPAFPDRGGRRSRSSTGHEDDEDARTNWSTVLLASYASAVTLALLWSLWTGRKFTRENTPQKSAVEGRAAESLARFRPPTPSPPPSLPPQNVVILGKTLVLGELEITPISVVRRPVELYRVVNTKSKSKTKGRYGSASLFLSLRLANRSPKDPLVPLDPADLRDASAADDQSFVETADGRRISMFPLAPESEWAIRGQEFPSLRPGEKAVFLVVSEPVEMSLLEGPLSWHVKVSTGSYRTDVVGISFSSANVKNQSR